MPSLRTVLPRLALGAAASALVLGLLFHLLTGGRGETTPAQLLGLLRTVVLPLAAVSVLCRIGQAVFRALRYAVLLRAAGEPGIPGFGHLLLVTLTRNMFVDLLPFRAGELTYIALLNRGYRVSAQACVSSLSVSMVFDFTALAVLIFGLVAERLARGEGALWMTLVGSALLLGTAAALAALFLWLPRLAHRWAEARPGGWQHRVAGFADRVGAAFAATRRARVVGRTLALSVGVRVWKYVGILCMFRAVTHVPFPTLAAAPPGDVLAALISAEAAASLPIPSLMSFGTYEAGGAAAWAALGFDAATAALAMLAVHLISQLVDYTMGGLAMLGIAMSARGSMPDALPPAGASLRRRAALAAAVIALAAAGAFTLREYRSLRRQGALRPPPAGHAVAAPSAAAPDGPRGLVVWSSNRAGNHDIWALDLAGGAPRPLTRHPHAEYYPRLSPSGRRLAFARSQPAWVSQRNKRAWDVLVLDLANGAERLAATNATAPLWVDEDRLVVQEDAARAVMLDLRDGARRVLAEAGRGGVPAGAELGTPDWSDVAGRLAATLRGSARMTALIAADGALRDAGGGCQMFWSPGADFLYLVDDTRGRMRHSFWRMDPATLERSLLFDAPEPWSHEYFPRLARDGRWLVYAACARGHEHDTADYEVFLWKVGDPPEAARRLTWHTGNDAWPDIRIEP